LHAAMIMKIKGTKSKFVVKAGLNQKYLCAWKTGNSGNGQKMGSFWVRFLRQNGSKFFVSH